ncbi:MAG TPA: response regulator [Terriglobales bacterium]|nr:response regulator [Terriglobales bacterium]
MARRILLADDSVTAQNMGRRILTDAGYEVVTVNNGSAALKKIAENRPDLIVLDVYMPGYGGLEVCQRIKESADTGRIPVLLTVGKLEPFKPEEARRVRADAFIVKPFEATELLTALTKLEDKIVAQPQPQKSGRFAKALAAVEQSDRGERFGDRETGWKSRLTIPDPNAKPNTSEKGIPDAFVTAPAIAGAPVQPERKLEGPPAEPAREFERPIPAGLPADITPEEIAAITAAAATFGGKTETSTAPETTAVSSPASQEVASAATPEAPPVEATAPATTFASAIGTVENVQSEAPAETAPAVAESVASEAAQTATPDAEAVKPEVARTEDQLAAAELPAPASELSSEIKAETSSAEAASRAAGDLEVMAALASLAPTNGHAVENARSGEDSVRDFAKAGEASPAVLAGAIAAARAAGPRWIAEAVTVPVEESTLALELEMQRASASHAVVEAAAAISPAAVIESPAPAALVEPEPSPIVAPVAEIPVPEIAVAEIPTGETPVPTATADAETAALASSVAEPEARDAEPSEPWIPPLAESALKQIAEPPAAQSAEPPRPEAVFAAAAAANSTASPVTVTPPAASESQAAAAAETALPREAELAAAWQNWKQIRESFVDSRPSSQVPDVQPEPIPPAVESSRPEEVVSSATAASPEPVVETAEVESAAGEVPGESTAIASIVDTMLAELRPKLVEEIAKKMSSEKKEKDKDKEKERKKKR